MAYSRMSELLSRHLGVNVARGSIHYYFKDFPRERKAWAEARQRVQERIAQEHERSYRQRASLEQRISRQMSKAAQKDPAFRDVLAYYRASPSTHADPEQLHNTFKMIRSGEYCASQVGGRTGLHARMVYKCCAIAKVRLKDGRGMMKRHISPAQVQEILASVQRSGYVPTAQMLGYSEYTVTDIAIKHGVPSPFRQGHHLRRAT